MQIILLNWLKVNKAIIFLRLTNDMLNNSILNLYIILLNLIIDELRKDLLCDIDHEQDL